MSYLRDTVVILRKEPFREQDRWYVMYGQEHGLMHAVARGAGASTSKQAPHLEPFSVIEVMIAKGVAFDKIAVACTKQGSHWGVDLAPVAASIVLGAFADIVIRLSRPGIVDERLFELVCDVREVLSRMPEEPSPLRARFLLAGATLKFLDLLGFAPMFPSSASLVVFIRRMPFSDLLRVSAPRETLNTASTCIEESLAQTLLDTQPRETRAVAPLLGVL